MLARSSAPVRYGCYAGSNAGGFGIQFVDAGMGVRGAQDRRMQGADGQRQIVEIAAAAGQQGGILDARQGLAGPGRAVAGWCRRVSIQDELLLFQLGVPNVIAR